MIVHNVLRNCQTCVTCKSPHRKPQGLLQPIIVHQPFELIAWNIVGPLRESSQGNKYIVVLIDYLTKWCEANALKDFSAKIIAKFLLEDVISRQGCPTTILFDQGTNFVSKVLHVHCQSLGIQ